MQTAHQTLITVSIGTALFLGVVEGASAQAKFSSHGSPNEYQPTTLGGANGNISLPSLMPETSQEPGFSSLPLSENYAFVEVTEDLNLLEFSSDPKLSDGDYVEQSVEVLVVQNLDVEVADSDGRDADTMDEGITDEALIVQADDVDESVDMPDAQLPESGDVISIDAEDSLVSEDESSVSEPSDISVPAIIDVDDLADELDPSEPPLIEIPDYLLAPTNPLFVPIEPETVELEGTQPITLEQALEISRRNSRELESALQQLEQSQEALRAAKADYLPTISTLGRLTHSNTDISNEPGAGTPGSPDGQPTVDNDLLLNARLDYDIFTSGQRSANVRAAEDAVKIQELQVEVVKEELRLSITSAYYDLQESDELVRIAEDTVEQSRISLRDALARERAGVGTRFDRLQAEVDLANDEQTLSNALRDQQVTRRQLVELLSIPPGIDVSAADPVEVAGSWSMPLEETLVLAYRNRAELEQQLLQRDLENQQARAALANRWPRLSTFAQYQINDLLDNTRVNADNEVLSVGLELNWTLYNGGATRAQARQQEIAAELAETQFADTREEIRFDVEQQYLNLGSSFKNIQTANSAVGLAEESLRLARLRFGAGVGIQSDVLEAQTRLTEAEVNLVTAILDYNRALVAIQRAVSNFPDNNLSADPVREP